MQSIAGARDLTKSHSAILTRREENENDNDIIITL